MSETTHAIILAAGFGSRLDPDEGHKLLVEIGGRTMLERHLAGFDALGVERVTVITGYAHEDLEAAVEEATATSDMTVRTSYNPDFERSNGISVLAGVHDDGEDVPFWLTMADHLFDPAFYADVAAAFVPAASIEGALFVDTKLDTIFDVPDANKLRFEEGGDLDAISKTIDPFDAVDVGFFWCGEGFVRALRAELDVRDDCSTSDAVRRLDATDAMAYPNVGDILWQDVDTPEARAHAASLVANWRG